MYHLKKLGDLRTDEYELIAVRFTSSSFLFTVVFRDSKSGFGSILSFPLLHECHGKRCDCTSLQVK